MLISRKGEQRLLLTAACADESQFIAVYGRRRVGKTYLVRETFNNTFTFQHSGLAKGNARQQLQSFADSLEEAGLDDFSRKLNDFRLVTNTKSAVHLTLITSEGLKQNLYSNTIQNVVVGNDLFEK